MIRAVAAIALLLATPAALRAADSLERDYSRPENRDKPITCKPGDIERQPGKSAGQLFGADWPDVPGADRVEARTIEPGHLKYPRGLESQRAVVVVAVLVGADGKPLRAETLCTTATGFDMAAKRLAMSAKYAPARVDGVPVKQPYPIVVKFSGVRPRGQRGAAAD